jgi:hypothetical protein
LEDEATSSTNSGTKLTFLTFYCQYQAVLQTETTPLPQLSHKALGNQSFLWQGHTGFLEYLKIDSKEA